MNEKIYPKLSPDERFKMVIQTFVNGDEAQREKLVKSCPKFTYTESDCNYTKRIEASQDIVTIFILQLLEYDKILSIMIILKGFNFNNKDFNNELKFVKEVQAFIFSFEVFCEDYVGIKAEDMILAWYGYDNRYVKMIEKTKRFLNYYQMDRDTDLEKIWLKRVFIYAWEGRINP